MLPRGDRKFCGIPVRIGNGAVTVKGSVWNEKPNQSKEIKVGRKLDKLFLFLNSSYVSAKRGDEIARCVVWYEDRKDWIPGKAEPFTRFSIRHNRNVADWFFADKAAAGELKLYDAHVAWRANGSNSNRGVYITEWVNPFPNRKIDAIMLEGVGAKAQVFLIGATGAVEKKSVAVRPESVPVEKRPDWAKKSKWCFKVDTDEYTCYMDGAAFILGICTKDGKMILGPSCFWLMQYKENGKLQNYQEYIGIPKVKVLRTGDTLSIVVPPQEGKLLGWERKITFQGKKISIEFSFRFMDSFKEQAQQTEHLSIFTRLTLPGFDLEKQTQKNAVFKNDSFSWEISFNPDSGHKCWWFDRNAKELRVSPGNSSDLRKIPGESFKIKVVLKPL